MNRLFSCGLAAATVLLFASPAHADFWDWLWGSEQNPELASDVPGLCEDYASKAVTAAALQSDKYNACGFSGPRYSPDRNAHYWWCMGARTSSVQAESTKRQEEMDKCSYCRLYSAEAQNMVRESQLYSCGLSGPRWSPNPDDHFRWCFSLASIDSASPEIRERAADLYTCKNRFTAAQIVACENAADKAVKQAKENARLRCGDSGPQWSQDRDVQFARCTRSTLRDPDNVGGQIAAEESERDKRNNFCALASLRRKGVEKPGAATQFRSGVTGKNAASSRKAAGVDTVNPANTKPCRPGAANDPCKPKSLLVQPGLLEPDAGLARQGPANAGSPIAPATTAPSGSTGVDTLRLR